MDETFPPTHGDPSLASPRLTSDPSSSGVDNAANNALVSADLSQELPFLVTNWLAQYGVSSSHGSNEDEEKTAALARVRHAASELASAFASLGAFGTVNRPNLSVSDSYYMIDEDQSQRASFSDARRRWSTTCPANQLESLVQAASLGSASVEQSVQNPVHLLEAAQERIQHQKYNPDSGRTLLDAINVDGDRHGTKVEGRPAIATSLQRPVVVRLTKQRDGGINNNNTQPSFPVGSSLAQNPISLVSDIAEKSSDAARRVRQLLAARESLRKNEDLAGSLQKSLTRHRETLTSLANQRGTVLAMNGSTDVGTKLKLLDEIKEGEENSNRVVGQLERQLAILMPTIASETTLLANLDAKARESFRLLQSSVMGFRDPIKKSFEPGILNNTVLFNLAGRQGGFQRNSLMPLARSFANPQQRTATSESHLAIFKSRFSHAVTINTHLAYPVFCLRFDKTGRYFITGADDYLAKVFCLGANVRPQGKSIDHASLFRGAVLVSSLRGHAGVINDIDVSPDNGFLATASEDGDCRIWGLRDGCPVAILRGHVDGCNMVSWSATTPYRLVTVAADGHARCWDVREACLKRYRKYIGKRPDYRLDLVEDVTSSLPVPSASFAHPPLPPIPVRLDEPSNLASATDAGTDPAPPIPLPADDASAGGPDDEQPHVDGEASAAGPDGEQNGDNGNAETGQFVANDAIDEGVCLLEKLRHGASIEEQLSGPGTRARRTPVKVICLARCPHGGHFATGSDDGICRLWKVEEDERVRTVDLKVSRKAFPRAFDRNISHERSTSSLHLIDLKGHINAITDLQYSYKGDRLLSASQKDGVVRIWSWNTDPASRQGERINATHIVIKLTNPLSALKVTSEGPRRRPIRASAASVSCDVAVWVCDDTKILTSQGEPVKQSSSIIIPGSQYLFVWDSFTGNCLLGIQGAHTMQCPVIVPHPKNSTIFCSAGSDGVLKLWDADSGTSFFSHKNTVQFGQVEAHERGKISGFLDGSFSSDGTSLVITDDNGRVSIFDCTKNRLENRESDIPAWMREQYFGNDYYDLLYVSHGYCVERGSELPPHLAPKGVRCAHAGASWSDTVNDSLRHLMGPLPIEERTARWHRMQVYSRAEAACYVQYTTRGNIVSQYDARTTLLLQCDGSHVVTSAERPAVDERVTLPREQASPRNVQRLSANWRWGDAFNELPDDGNDEDEPDADDEDYVIGTDRRSSNRQERMSLQDSDDEELGDDEDDASVDSPRHRRSGRRFHDSDEDSDGDDFLEYMSTNNSPSGPFVGDYETYIFKMGSARDAHSVSRAWLRRVESDSSYSGRKIYAPQLGDSVIYIPRAHQETIAAFPSLLAPWQNWPEGASWPVVQCCVRHMRFRFPFKSYFKQGDVLCKSIIAVLTLEVTGTPVFSHEETLFPTFTSPANRHSFELALFENDLPDYVLPSDQFTARLKMVEAAREGLVQIPNPPVVAMFRSFSAVDTQIEDEEFVPWRGHIERFVEGEDSHESGFDGLEVSWMHGGGTDMASPWEITQVGSAPIDIHRPYLGEEEIQCVEKALAAIKALTFTNDEGLTYRVESIFGVAVNETQYSDYSTRVEVPMDLSFVAERLASNYYGSTMSVVADIRLIRDNCAKYNGDQDPMTLLANDMVNLFEEEVLSEEQRSCLREFGAMAAASASLVIRHGAAAANAPLAARSTRTRVVRNRSVLEGLDNSPTSITSRSRRASSRQRNPTRNSHERTQTIGRTASDNSNNLRRSSRQVSRTGSGGDIPDNQENNNLLQSGRGRGRNQLPGNGDAGRTRSSRLASIPINRETSSGDVAHASSNRHGTRSAARGEAASLGNLELPAQPSRTTSRQAGTVRGSSEQDDRSLNVRTSRSSRGGPSRSVDATSFDLGSRHNTDTRRRQSSLRFDEQAALDSDQEILPQNGSRTRPRRRQVVHDTSDEEGDDDASTTSSEDDTEADDEVKLDEDSSDDDEEEEKEEQKPRARVTRGTKRSRQPTRSSRAPRNSPSRSAGRRQASQKSYADPSSSEFDDEDEDDAAQPLKRPKTDGRKPRSAIAINSPAQSIEAPPTKRSWKFVDTKHITAVGHGILDRLQEVDASGTFAIPVAEAFPEVAKEYLKVIKKPMDFRTIREDRLPWYKCADELREDLLLVFNNCIVYNDDDSEYADMARSLMYELDDTFKAVCEDHGVRLPRRW